MGIGDEIMVAGEIKRCARAHPTAKFRVLDPRNSRHRWDDIWDGNPLIVRPGEQYTLEVSMGPGARPYIQAKMMTQWFWKDYRPTPADIYLREPEEEYASAARGKVVITPTLKPNASPNKQWSFAFWERLVTEHPEVPWLQVGSGSELRRLPVPYLLTPSFRHAVGALKGARAAVLQEGGLHHAAAAVGLKSVVIYGGFISPRSTGYAMHTNLFRGEESYPLGCGMRTPCQHCVRAMRSIHPQDVFNELEKLL